MDKNANQKDTTYNFQAIQGSTIDTKKTRAFGTIQTKTSTLNSFTKLRNSQVPLYKKNMDLPSNRKTPTKTKTFT